MIPPIPNLADYGIDPDKGFLPPESPVDALPDPYYARWEAIVANLQALLLSKQLRGTIESMPALSTGKLRDEPEWRRAYVLLILMLHGYIWGGDTPAQRIPPQLTIPLLKVSAHLDIPPVATYAGLVLWNYRPIFPEEPADDLDNLSIVSTLTGSLDEQWFYLISVAIEARGAPTLPLMLEAFAAVRYGDNQRLAECLRQFAEIVDDLGTLLQRMYENCDPHVFYHRIRPFLAGSKNMADAGLPNGVIYDEGSGKETYRQYCGGSNAQSSLIQFFDIALGVEHRPTGEPKSEKKTSSKNAENGPQAPKPRHNFIEEMRTYMPGPHRRFLEHVASVANIREYVDQHRSDKALCLAYDACLAMLRVLRDKHIQMVSRYVVIKSRESRNQSSSDAPHSATPRAAPGGMNLARVTYDDGKGGKKKLRGTGGTALIPFLKQARDETGEPAIGAWARRLLSNAPADSTFATLGKVDEHADGHMEVVGLAGTWTMDDSEGGLCHW